MMELSMRIYRPPCQCLHSGASTTVPDLPEITQSDGYVIHCFCCHLSIESVYTDITITILLRIHQSSLSVCQSFREQFTWGELSSGDLSPASRGIRRRILLAYSEFPKVTEITNIAFHGQKIAFEGGFSLALLKIINPVVVPVKVL